MAAPMHSVFVGAETGLLKGVTLSKSQYLNLNNIENAEKEKELCVMCWGDENETEVCIGLKNKQVLVYDVANKSFQNEVHSFDSGSGRLRGLAKVEQKYLTAVESGLVKLWNDDEDNCIEINAGNNLHTMTKNQQHTNMIATGGKENDLKVWNLESPTEPTFKAKNVKNDWLNLRVPVWVTGVQFLPDSDKIVSCTGHHQVRVYDPTCQRRPVIDVSFDEFPLTAMSLRQDIPNQVVIGNTQGNMALLDLRNGKLLHVYKGFAGGIRDIQCHQSKPLVASCGLDRHLRVHNIDSKEMVHKVYLKSRLNCLLFSTKDENNVEEQKKKEAESTTMGSESGIESADDDDEIWENLEVVQTRTVRKNDKQAVEECVKTSQVKRKKKGKTVDSGSEKKKLKKKK